MQKILLSLTLLFGFTISASAQNINVSPCSCLNNATQNGNTNNFDGQFQRTISIVSGPGEIWTVLSGSDIYYTTSPAPPAAPIAVNLGDTLPETSPGVYEIDVLTIDNVPFFASFTNGTAELDASEICHYPHPTLSGVDPGYCSSDAPTSLSLTSIPPLGVASFDVSGSPVTEIDPSLYVGAQTLHASWVGAAFGPQDPGCAVDLTANFYVHPEPSLTPVPVIVCEGESIDLNTAIIGILGDSITEFHDGSPTGPLVSNPAPIYSSTDIFAVSISKGGGACIGSVELVFNVLTPSSVANTVSLCQGDSIVVNGHVYNAGGVYMDTLNAANGCDSVIQTILTIHQPSSENLSFTICEGENIVVNGITYDTTGTYVDHLLNAAGCDSTINISLVVNKRTSFTQTLTLCDGQSVTVGVNVYNANGTYNDTLINVANCDSFVTTNLTVLPNTGTYQSFSYCGSGTVVVGSHTYTTTGLYSDTLPAVNGCDSVVTTDLVVNPADVINQNISLCQGQTVTVGGNVYGSNGVYNDTMSNMYGCDSIVNTTVYVIPHAVNIGATICSNGSFVVGPHVYTTSGSYLDTLLNSLGCDSIVALDLDVLSTSSFTQNVSFCAGGSVTVGTSIYTAAGTYQDTVLNSVGCDSFITTTVSILATSASAASPVICQGDTFFVGTSAYTASGSYSDTLMNAAGCDSVITTNLTVNPTASFSQNITICAGQSVSVGSNIYTTSGTYHDTLTSSIGCDSMVTTTLVVNNPTSYSQTLSLCFGQSATVGVHVYTANGLYSDTLMNIAGCDSIITTDLTVMPQIVNNQSAAICQGDSFTVGTHVYFVAGVYADTLAAANGCDSIVHTDLSVNPLSSSSMTASACFGQSVTINAVNYTASGTYVQHFTNSLGCDSSLNIDVTILPQNVTNNTVTLCFGQTLSVGSNIYASNGVYADTLTAADGCDSIIHTDLTILPVNMVTQTITLCNGQSIAVGGNTYNVDGVYNDTLTAASGCDSVIVTNLTVLLPLSSSQSVTLCQGDSVAAGNSVYYAAGTYTDTVAGYMGCDSVITTVVTITPASFFSQSLTICQGQSVVVGSNTYTMLGVYTDTIVNAAGCDSIITTDLSVIPINYSQSFTVCNGQSILVGSNVYNASGTYTDTLLNVNSCDSIILTTLNVLPALSGSQTAAICQGQSISVGSHIYTAAGVYTDTLLSANSCDSIVTTTLTVNAPTASTQNVNLCLGQSITVGLHVYNASGTYTDTISNSNGCDSVITTILNVISPTSGGQSLSLCAGHSIAIGSHVYTAAGTYLDTLVSTLGCDSFYLSTEIVIVPAVTSSQSFTICQGQSVTVGAHVYTANGVYNDTLAASNTCDSIITTTLTVTPSAATSQNLTICQGQSVTVGSHVYNASGVYLDTLVAVSTCDSIITTNLTVTNAITASISAHICGGTYSFGGQALSVSGTYSDTIPNGSASGCDSVTTLTLTVGQPTSSTLNQSICEGAAFSFNGNSLTTNGIYLDTLVNASGCDSIITLNLIVNERPNLGADQTDSVCSNATFNLSTLSFNGLLPIVWNTATPNAVTPGSYVGIYTDANGCKDTANAVINSKVTPSPLVLTQGDSSFCAGTILKHFTVTNIPGAAYTWAYTGTGANLIPNGNQLDIDFGSDATSGQLSVSAVPANLCGTQVLAINLQLAAVPTVTLTSNDADNVICVGQPVTITASGNDVKGIWVNGVADSATTITFTVNSDTIYNIYSFATNACTTVTANLQLIGHALPVADAGIDTAVARGSWTQLEGTASGSPPFTYAWTPDSTLNYNNVKNPVASPTASVTYFLMVMDMYGCMAADSVNITVTPGEESLNFPNVLTPNGDGNNDVWKIDLDKFPGANLVIFNRWGEVVYESAGYNNDWNGTFQNNGKQLPDGTYYFALKADAAGSTVYKGAINLFNYKK